MESLPADPWALILGASSGVGAAIAGRLARDGFNIYGVHRGHHPEGAAAVTAAVTAAGRRCVLWQHDAGTAEAAEAGVADFTARTGGRAKVLIHSLASAAVGRLTGPDRLHPRQFAATFDRMAHSFVYWIGALHAAGRLAPNARLLGLGNIMTESVVRGTPLVAATKAALHQYVRHLAAELGPEGHRVNVLKFGYIATQAVSMTFPDDAAQVRLEAVMRQGTPAGTLTTPDEVADSVSWLVGPAADRFNGAVIDFTGAEGHGFFDALVYPRES